MSDDATIPPTNSVVVNDDNARKWLAVAVIAQFVIVVGYIILKVKAEATNAQMLILGAEIGFVSTVLNYFFGSSSGSTQKGQMLDRVRQ